MFQVCRLDTLSLADLFHSGSYGGFFGCEDIDFQMTELLERCRGVPQVPAVGEVGVVWGLAGFCRRPAAPQAAGAQHRL